MGFFEAINSVFAGFFRFSGRATRSEYWWFFLFDILIMSVLGVIDGVMFFKVLQASASDTAALAALGPFDFLLSYYLLITFCPRMAVTVRRLHDVGLSGFFYLLYLVPVVGGIVVFVLTLLPSEGADNGHGPTRTGPRAPRRFGGTPRQAGKAPRKHDPMQGYAVLDRINAPTTPEMLAARKAEVRALYESRVLGRGAIAAE